MRISDELVTYNSSQTCPYTLETVAQPDLRNKIQTCLKIVKLLHNSQPTPYAMKQSAQQHVLCKLFDSVWGPVDGVRLAVENGHILEFYELYEYQVTQYNPEMTEASFS